MQSPNTHANSIMVLSLLKSAWLPSTFYQTKFGIDLFWTLSPRVIFISNQDCMSLSKLFPHIYLFSWPETKHQYAVMYCTISIPFIWQYNDRVLLAMHDLWQATRHTDKSAHVWLKQIPRASSNTQWSWSTSNCGNIINSKIASESLVIKHICRQRLINTSLFLFCTFLTLGNLR